MGSTQIKQPEGWPDPLPFIRGYPRHPRLKSLIPSIPVRIFFICVHLRLNGCSVTGRQT
jgi:hypothetical protein